jgi:hypothetical protein
MNEDLQALIDDYLNGLLDEVQMQALEERLRGDPDARRLYVRYARLHTDLHLEAHARQSADRALEQISGPVALPSPSRLRRLAVAALLLLALGAAGWLLLVQRFRSATSDDPVIAALVNAQNCKWADGAGPEQNLQAGKVLTLEMGLAEIRFRCGARVVLEGPAALELLSGHSARLRAGKLTARVPQEAVGFELLSPQGRVIDLGTEFGISVSDSGATDVFVFEGKVEAHPGAASKERVLLTQNQSARIDAGKVTVQPAEPPSADHFVRAIVPPPAIVPRTLRLTFDRAAEHGVRDRDGLRTGLTHRLPGTGSRLPEHDPNLRLDTARSLLELTTTESDINTQFKLFQGEYLGVRLVDLGFTGKEDFAVTATIPDIPALEFIGQFGLYAGTRSNKNIRGGLLATKRGEPGQYTQFLVNNADGRDSDLGKVGLLSTGADLRLTLQRTAGKYTLTVENLTAGSASTLSIRHPAFLDGARDLHVGLFGANPRSEVRKPLVVKEFQATVWTVGTAGK